MSELPNRLVEAADDFPVRGWSPDLSQRVTRRRRRRAGLAVVAGFLAATGIALAVPMVVNPGPAADRAADSTSVDYVGRRWRLVSVDDRTATTTMPTKTNATLELRPNGEFVADDTVNAIFGRFTRTADGFEVSSAGSTLAGYAGHEPDILAAKAAIGALAGGTGSARNRVIVADGARLVIQAGTYRLTFEPTGTHPS